MQTACTAMQVHISLSLSLCFMAISSSCSLHDVCRTACLTSAQLELERAIGLTTSNAAGLACNAATGEIAYLAGSVVVVYNVLSDKQTTLLTAPRAVKVLSCVAYSPHGGKFVCAGEVRSDISDGICCCCKHEKRIIQSLLFRLSSWSAKW